MKTLSRLSFVILFFFLSRISLAAVPSQVEYNALIAFYNSTGGSTWYNKTGWNSLIPGPAQDVSGCYGIVQDADGHIIELYLKSNNLQGVLPTQIGDLTFLQQLRLAENRLTGAIPSSIQNLDALITLDLRFNFYSDTPFPPGISGMSSLQKVYIDCTGSLPSDIGNATNLKVISCGGLDGILPASLNTLVNLDSLNFEGSSLSGSLPDFTNFVNLEYFNVNNNSN